MTSLPTQSGRHLLDGAVRVFMAAALMPLTGVITAAFLTRRLGPGGYGLLVLTATLIIWVEWGINSFLMRATVKFVSEAKDWRPIGTTVVRLHLLLGGFAALLVWLFAIPLARLLNEPALAPLLCLFALDIPICTLAQAHQNILVGMGNFRKKAVGNAGRWIARLFLILVLVEMGLSVQGAILGSIGASLVELTISRLYVRPSFFGNASVPVRSLGDYGFPILLSALSVSCYSNLDLFLLKILGGTTQQAGLYGAAQNLSILPAIFGMSFSPLLLSTMSRLLSLGEVNQARVMGRNAMRLVLGLLPIGAMIAGAAPEIVRFFFGPLYEPAGPLVAVLFFGAVGLVMTSITMAIVTASGSPRLNVLLTGPLVPFAVVSYLVFIPRFGPLGAALVTTLFASLGAMVTVLAVYRLWGICPPAGTLGRTVLVSVLAYSLAVLWSASGALLIVKLLVIGIVIVLTYFALREFSMHEIALVRSLLGWRPASAQHQPGA